VLFAASSFQAIYGVAHLASGNTSVLGLWTKEYFFDDATGTFVNRNHFSGMLAIASPLVLSDVSSNCSGFLSNVVGHCFDKLAFEDGYSRGFVWRFCLRVFTI